MKLEITPAQGAEDCARGEHAPFLFRLAAQLGKGSQRLLASTSLRLSFGEIFGRRRQDRAEAA
jgi:hypothetical protein